MNTQTEEISKTIALLRFETIRDSLKQAKRKSVGDKKLLVKNYEDAVLDVGIEKFVSRLNDEVTPIAAKLVNVETGTNQSIKEGLTEAIQSTGLTAVLGKADEDLLKKFSVTLGLDDETADYARKIEDEVMLIGMEGFLQLLAPDVLRKHCAELKLLKTGDKGELVERLMVHIFELEPLSDKEKDSAGTAKKLTDSKEKEKEEAKPKENKKRKADVKSKNDDKKFKKAEEKDAAPGQRPKRKVATKRKDDDDEEKPTKKPRREPAAKKEKAEIPDETPKEVVPNPKENTAPKKKEKGGARAPYVAPALSTIVKGQYSTADLHNKFNLTDLQKYCKQEGLKSSGPKKVLIKRIGTYLETGKKDEHKKEAKKNTKSEVVNKATKPKKATGSKKKTTPKEGDKEKAEATVTTDSDKVEEIK